MRFTRKPPNTALEPTPILREIELHPEKFLSQLEKG